MEGDDFYRLDQNCLQKSHGPAGASTRQVRLARGRGTAWVLGLSAFLTPGASPGLSQTLVCDLLSPSAE